MSKAYDFILNLNAVGGTNINDALLKAIRKSPKFCDIPVLMVTAHTDVDNMLLSSRLGSSDYLTKPFTLKQFEDKLADGLKTHILPTKDKIHDFERGHT